MATYSGALSISNLTFKNTSTPSVINVGTAGTNVAGSSTFNFGVDTNIQDGKKLTVGTSLLVADASNNTVDIAGLITANQNSNVVNIGKSGATTNFVGTSSFDALATTGKLTVGGDLVVNGTTTTVNSTQINTSDNMLVLNANPAQATATSGIAIQRYAADVRAVSVDKMASGGIASSPSALATSDVAPTITVGSLALEGSFVTANLLNGGLLIFVKTSDSTVAGSIRYTSATENAGTYVFTTVGSPSANVADLTQVTIEVYRAAFSGLFYSESANQFQFGLVNKDLAAGDTLSVVRKANAAMNNILADGNAQIGGALSVTGVSTLAGLTAGASSLASASVVGAATIGTTLSVAGASTLATVNVSGLATVSVLDAGASTLASAAITQEASVGATLSVVGNATFSSNVAMAQDLNVQGATTLVLLNAGTTTLDAATVTNDLGVNGALSVVGNTTLAGLNAQAVSMASATIAGALTAGASTLSSVNVTANAAVGGTLAVTGTSTLAGLVAAASTLDSLSVTNAAAVSGALTVTGASNLNGALTVADGVASVLGGSLLVKSDATLQGNLTLSGMAQVDSFNSTGSSTVGGNLFVNGVTSKFKNVVLKTDTTNGAQKFYLSDPASADHDYIYMYVDPSVTPAVLRIMQKNGAGEDVIFELSRQ